MSNHRTDAETIRDLEEQRYRALRDSDLAALDRLLADEMCYLHSNATSDSKASLLAKIRNQELRCSDARHHPDERIVVSGDAAIATGRVTGTVYVGGVPVPLSNRALAVWTRRRDGWRLLAYQSTPISTGEHEAVRTSTRAEAR